MRQTTIRDFIRALTTPDAIAEDVPSDDRRNAARHEARQHVALRFRSSRLICDLTDLSESGAKISVLDGIVPDVDETVSLTLFDGTIIVGRVSWLKDRHIGVEFVTPVTDVDERLDFENLGRNYYQKAVRLQKSARRV
ncbi:PilZ domain-containing protein [Hyphomicrobium sp. 99]|uniref:PilZ domain-containing protein n=1 Tax=Hyphomicrobium sp. 99 TaxID=1163419 RepID=UPI0005F80ECA|nr:PilZ domain-containing protein [Hyphomicrobium sp. 99]